VSAARAARAAQAAQAVQGGPGQRPAPAGPGFDPWLGLAALALLAFGLVMVCSASVSVADSRFGNPLHYFQRQAMAASIALTLGLSVMYVPLESWRRASPMILALGLFLLALVLVPGLGREVNGSLRWLQLGPVGLQPSEPAKLCFIIYLADYLVRHGEQVRGAFAGFIKPVAFITLFAVLLLLEPDYGATVVLFTTVLGMLFLGGVPLGRFAAWSAVAVSALGTIAVLAPYRMQRVMTFMDPWADPFDSGFQLTQALIAFGRGEWTGVGLGASVQKLLYLPEVHTDFVLAVIAEEFGLAGTVLVILAYTFILWRMFEIGLRAARAGLAFAANLSFGIAMLIGTQAFFNIGVNMGVLPTKGLTLPLVSYGANSLIACALAVALVMRAGYEADVALLSPRRRARR